jgi:3-oxoacyl-[acyl-carrier-protein] synthase-3
MWGFPDYPADGDFVTVGISADAAHTGGERMSQTIMETEITATRFPATIEGLAVFLPQRAIEVEEVAAEFELTAPQTRMLRRVHGFGQLRADPSQDLIELVAAAGRRLLESVSDRTTIRYLIFAHTVGTITPSSLSAPVALAELLGLDHAEPFAIGQQYCANGLSALDVAGELLRADGDPRARALLLTGEKRLSSLTRLLGTSTVIGEASAACLVGIGGHGDRVLSYADHTVSLASGADGFSDKDSKNWVSDEMAREFIDCYPEVLAKVSREAVRRAGLTMDHVTLVLPHNVSRQLWHRTIPLLGIGLDRIYLDTVPEFGHCYCSDPFLNLAMLRDRGRLVDGGIYLLASVGLGATHAAVVLEHRGERRD